MLWFLVFTFGLYGCVLQGMEKTNQENTSSSKSKPPYDQLLAITYGQDSRKHQHDNVDVTPSGHNLAATSILDPSQLPHPDGFVPEGAVPYEQMLAITGMGVPGYAEEDSTTDWPCRTVRRKTLSPNPSSDEEEPSTSPTHTSPHSSRTAQTKFNSVDLTEKLTAQQRRGHHRRHSTAGTPWGPKIEHNHLASSSGSVKAESLAPEEPQQVPKCVSTPPLIEPVEPTAPITKEQLEQIIKSQKFLSGPAVSITQTIAATQSTHDAATAVQRGANLSMNPEYQEAKARASTSFWRMLFGGAFATFCGIATFFARNIPASFFSKLGTDDDSTRTKITVALGAASLAGGVYTVCHAGNYQQAQSVIKQAKKSVQDGN